MAGSPQDPKRPRKRAAPPPSKVPPRRTAPPAKAGPEPARAGAPQAPFVDVGTADRDPLERLHRRRNQPWLIPLIGGLVLIVAAVAVGLAIYSGGREPMSLLPVDDRKIDELASLEFDVAVRNVRDAADAQLEYSLVDAPDGAAIDPKTGRFHWTPREDQGPGWYEMTVHVSLAGTRPESVSQKFAILVCEVAQPPVFEPVEDKTVQAGQTLAFSIEARDPDVPGEPLRFRLAGGAPQGAQIDPHTGEFQWTPRQADAGQAYEITVQAGKGASGALRNEVAFSVRVEGMPEAAVAPVAKPDLTTDPLIEALRADGLAVVASGEPMEYPVLAGSPSVWSVGGQRFVVFEYAGAAEAKDDAGKLSEADIEPFIDWLEEKAPAYLFHADRVAVFYVGRDAQLLNRFDRWLGRPALVARIDETPSGEDIDSGDKFVEANAAAEAILELYEDGKLVVKSEYPRLRKIYADEFVRLHADEIRAALGDENSEMQRWLAEHAGIREEFYLAIDPEHDDLVRCLQLFKALWERFPDKFEKYANLAIAVAVVWDRERGAIYEYGGLVHHAKATMPEGMLGAAENFQYLIDAEKFMQGRIQFLPWEFLVLLVDHRTPLQERQWAVMNYVPKRVGFGKCYQDVPYDYDMLNGKEAHLAGKVYTLPNLRAYGGVCAYQGDFAARVGKSIGVPAFYAAAEGKWGIPHAWVMWVELGTVTATGFTFELKSHGRYGGDKYYVGNTHDPHTGQGITDRTLELRLTAVGMDPVAKRHADLVMRSYPLLCDLAQMDVTAKLILLNKVIEYSPGNEAAWMALAQMSREGLITKANSKPMLSALNRLFVTFAKVPDFTWQVFDDMVAFQDLPKKRAALYSRLCGMYEQAGRPDLSCEARLKFTEYLEAEEQYREGVEVLAAAIMLFPDEGRYVPRMLDRLEQLAQKLEGSQEPVLRLYQVLLPKIPKKRGDLVSQYCKRMYKRGAERFRQAGLVALAQFYEMELAKLEADEAR